MTDVLAGLIGVGLLVLVVVAGLFGVQSPPISNFAPTFIYVIFWVGLVPASILFGDVFKAFNPWRAIARGTAFVASRVAGPLPASFPYPARLGHWPAVATLLCFTWMELAYIESDKPETLAIATLIYTARDAARDRGLRHRELDRERRGLLRLLQPLLANLAGDRQGGKVGLPVAAVGAPTTHPHGRDSPAPDRDAWHGHLRRRQRRRHLAGRRRLAARPIRGHRLRRRHERRALVHGRHACRDCRDRPHLRDRHRRRAHSWARVADSSRAHFRAHAGPDRGRLRDRALLLVPRLQRPGDRLSGIRPAWARDGTCSGPPTRESTTP